MTREELIKTIDESGYEYIGIRHLEDDEEYAVGDFLRNSYDWNYEYDCSSYHTDEPVELPGTCAYHTGIRTGWDDEEELAEKLDKAIFGSSCYSGKAVIIGGNRSEWGNDEHEIIIEDAVVIAILD